MSLRNLKVAIIGLGQIGGSLGRDLVFGKVVKEVIGSDRDRVTRRWSMRTKAVHRVADSLSGAVRSADLVVLAVPVRRIVSLLPQVAQHLKPGAVVFDVGSTKREIVRAMERLPRGILACGGHPMAGTEKSGIRAAQKNLFTDKAFFLVPTRKTKPESLALCRRLVRAVGARPVVISAAAHDRLLATTSHLPYLLAVALLERGIQVARRRRDFWSLLGGGFASATRVAKSNPELMLDILASNRTNVASVVDDFGRTLKRYARALRSKNDRRLRRSINCAFTASRFIR